jgi:hypothetical protein
MHAYFKTSKFRQVLDDDEIDRVILGEDCVEWLRAQLSSHKDIVTKSPILEDWGWTMALSLDGSELWMNVQDWSFEREQTWHLWIEPRGILARINTRRLAAASRRLRELIEEVLSGDAEIREVRWSQAPPA